MSSTPWLKAENAWLVRGALLLHAAVFAYVAFEPFVLAQLTAPDAVKKLQAALAPATLSLAVIGLAKLILLGLVPPRFRDRLIHWRWGHPLPGARAFSKIGPADQRVGMGKIEGKYGPLPTEQGEQGRLFYKVYSSRKDSPGVLDAHRSYLAARDIGTLNFIMLVLLPPLAYWATGDGSRTALYAAALFLAFILLAYAAQMYGIRLVENSLAAASADPE